MHKLEKPDVEKLLTDTDMADPINKLQQLMIITAEECGELTQVCSKTVRKFKTIEEANDQTDPKAVENHKKLVEELGDVFCMLDLMVENGMATWEELGDRLAVKRKKLEKWSDLIND